VVADYVLIDCPPSLGLMTVNALVAAGEVLIPSECEILSLRGLNEFWKTLERVRAELNPDLQVLGVLPTMTRRTKHHDEIWEVLKASIPEGVVFDRIPQSIRVSEAHAAGWPVARLDQDNVVSEAYRQLARRLDRG
jgi:chromosome partitioning protein